MTPPMEFTYKSDATFCEIAKHVINSEGKFANLDGDPGGPTMYGVAFNYNRGWLKDRLGIVDPLAIVWLTIDQAKQCYYERYWLPSEAEGITSLSLAYIHLDAAINCGVGTAKGFLNKLSKNPKNFDGSGGKNLGLFLTLFMEYTALRLSYYTHCKGRDRFLTGWINRMTDVIRNAIKLG